MRFYSTRNDSETVSAAQAIVQGLSKEGGLFVPEAFPQVDLEEVCALPDYPAMAAHILQKFLTEYSEAFLTSAAQNAYGPSFHGKAGQLSKVSDGLFALELWHGPTCAFKDYALQLMPHLLVEGKKILGRQELTYILVATSGDTGKAALAGYQDIPGIKITVFYPADGTSQVQRMQMTTQAGENVAVFAVNGNFDDAQTDVKKAFADKELEAELAQRNVRLSSANSINWGRLVPQIVYYFAAYQQLVQSNAIALGEPVDFCVPTGNFGDILAGYYAKRMGLPVHKLVCASNRNNVLTEFLRTGVYDARRQFYRTTSPSMDILVSSNLERLLYHMSGSAQKVAGWMDQLAREGYYQVDEDCLAKIQEVFAAGCADDVAAAGQLREVFEKDGYLCDTHTAVAFHAAKEYAGQAADAVPMVVLSTANPYKFPKDVLAALGQTAPEDEFEAMDALAGYTGTRPPEELRGLQGALERFDKTIRPEEITAVARMA